MPILRDEVTPHPRARCLSFHQLRARASCAALHPTPLHPRKRSTVCSPGPVADPQTLPAVTPGSGPAARGSAVRSPRGDTPRTGRARAHPGAPRGVRALTWLAAVHVARPPQPVPAPPARPPAPPRRVPAPGGVGRGGAFPGATQPPDRRPVRPATSPGRRAGPGSGGAGSAGRGVPPRRTPAGGAGGSAAGAARGRGGARAPPPELFPTSSCPWGAHDPCVGRQGTCSRALLTGTHSGVI